MKSKSIQKEIDWKEKFIELVGQNIAVAINGETHLPNTSFEWVGKAVNTISPKIDVDKLTLFIGDLLIQERQRTLEEVEENMISVLSRYPHLHLKTYQDDFKRVFKLKQQEQ